MIVANPIYGTVFKRLMEDNERSKFIVSTLLGKPVVTIETMLPFPDTMLSFPDTILLKTNIIFNKNKSHECKEI
jgi:hypothetical protein